jgi:hypothetical protein
MPKPTKSLNANTCYTAEAFREIVEAATEELFENAGSYEIKNLATWSADLKKAVGRVADHQGDNSVAEFGRPNSSEAL